MKILLGNSNRTLGELVCQKLGVQPVKALIKRFLDNEAFVEIEENVRGEDVFVLQSTSNPANENIMELLICIDALKRASAKRITAVIPYFGYARQDRKPGPRAPISAKLFANILTTAGTDRVLTVDLHAGQIQGFFDIPLDNLYAAPIFIEHIRKNIDYKNAIIVSPDAGGVARARAYAKRLDLDLAIVDKRREKPGVSEVMNIIGDVGGKHCIIIDDIVDSGGTLCNASKSLLDKGAKSVCSYITHPVLSSDAQNKINNSTLTKLFVTDTIKTDVVNEGKIEIISISLLLAEAIKRISEESSISVLFD